MRLISKFLELLTAVLTISLTASFPATASLIPLQSDITWYWLKPNLGANLVDLGTPGAYIDYGGQRLDSFSFYGATGSGAPMQSNLWLVFSEPSGMKPKLVFYDLADETRSLETTEHMEFGVSWRVSNLNGTKLSSATVGATEVSAGLFGNSGSASIVQSVFGEDDALLGAHTAGLTSPGFGSRTQSTLQFDPQSSVRLSSLVKLDNAGFLTFGATAGEALQVPEPTTLALVCVSLVGAVVAQRRRRTDIGSLRKPRSD